MRDIIKEELDREKLLMKMKKYLMGKSFITTKFAEDNSIVETKNIIIDIKLIKGLYRFCYSILQDQSVSTDYPSLNRLTYVIEYYFGVDWDSQQWEIFY